MVVRLQHHGQFGPSFFADMFDQHAGREFIVTIGENIGGEQYRFMDGSFGRVSASIYSRRDVGNVYSFSAFGRNQTHVYCP